MSDPARISPKEASDMLAGGWTYVDVRTTQEFESGHPSGAVNVPIMHASGGRMLNNPDFVRVMTAAFPKEAKIIVGCKSGGRSLRAAQTLLAEGFKNVLVQHAGWDGARSPFGEITEPGWSRAGLPSEQGQPPERSWEDMKKKLG
jgi:rhodanese-related sulfurtransferase